MAHVRPGPVQVWCAAVAAGAGLLLSSGADGQTVKGAACKGGNCTGVKDWKPDQGADDTILSRACAAAIGLLADGDGDGTPDQSNGSQAYNSGSIQTWCFRNVGVGAVSSTRQNCVNTTTVYVSKKADHWGGRNLLGKPWQQRVDACFRAKTETVTWPWQQPAKNTPQKRQVPKPDSSGQTKRVIEDVVISGPGGSPLVDMVILYGANQSVIPQSVAAAAGLVPIGQTDLPVDDPELWRQLEIASMNLTLQTIFDIVVADLYDLGLGPPGAAHQLLVSDDANSLFGVIGGDMLPQDPGTFEEYLLSVATGIAGALFYTVIDCDGDGIPDDLQILDDPSLDQNGNGILDSCELPAGAMCLAGVGGCFEGPGGFATFIGAAYQGDGTNCQDVECPGPDCDPAGALTIVEGMLFISKDGLDDFIQAFTQAGEAEGAIVDSELHIDQAENLFAQSAAASLKCGKCTDPAQPEYSRSLQNLTEARMQNEQARMQIQQARVQLQTAGAQLDLASQKHDLVRLQLLLDPPDTARAKQKLQEARLQTDRAKQELDRAKAKLERAKGKLMRAREKLQRIRSQVPPIQAILTDCGPCAILALDLLFLADAEVQQAEAGNESAIASTADASTTTGFAATNAEDTIFLINEALALLNNCGCPTDVNGDGVTNVLDLIDLLLCFGQSAVPGCESEDVNEDGTVNVLDLIDLLLAFGTACP